MSSIEPYTEAELVHAVEQILGVDAECHRRGQTMWWGDALLRSAERSFVTMRPEDKASAQVRHAIGFLNDDLELDPLPFVDSGLTIK